ncbi:hypothetical protein B0H14DRAFT_2600993 [Mycena olivaceomarginata]|nr:hypothetical protein B0H14DRAFT_2600993 [Mycena olivaceomarginata]
MYMALKEPLKRGLFGSAGVDSADATLALLEADEDLDSLESSLLEELGHASRHATSSRQGESARTEFVSSSEFDGESVGEPLGCHLWCLPSTSSAALSLPVITNYGTMSQSNNDDLNTTKLPDESEGKKI